MKNFSTGRLGRLFINAVPLESRSPGSVVINKRNTTDAGLKLSSMTLCDERRGGFTLIELLVVVLIIGILSAVALPQYTLAVEKTRAAEAMVHLKAIQQAADLCALANPGADGDSSLCRYMTLGLNIPGVVFEEAGDYGTGKYFEYNCDNPDCRGPYVHRENSAYDYWIQFRDHAYDQKNTCYGDNEKGQRLCKALGGRQLEQAGERIIYEL